jgi:hypothetical protein
VNFAGDGAQSARTVVNGVHRRDHGEEHLSCANIARRFIAADVLFARLQGKPVTGLSGRIVRDADETASHMPLVSVAGRKVGGVRSSKAERNAEPLGAPDGDIRAEFAGWPQERES